MSELQSRHVVLDRLFLTTRSILWIAPLLASFAMVFNTYSYSLLSAIPLVQSDVWKYLDGWLGRFLESGFSVRDLFAQEDYGGMNQPLQKLLVMFHTRYYGMDFRIEGVVGTLAGICLVALLLRSASGSSPRRWSTPEFWLSAALCLSLLSLNSTNVYTWPLATLWFVPILIAMAYAWFVFSRPTQRAGLAIVSFALGVLIDEVALPVFASVTLAMLVVRSPSRVSEFRAVALFGGAGVVASRLFYLLVETAVPASATGAARSVEASGGFLKLDIWKAALIPLGDSVIHQANLASVLAAPVPLWIWWGGAVALLIAHVWFWYVILIPRRACAPDSSWTATRMAASLMLLFYGLVAGIVLQRVSGFGFDYLHQPRYVLFYQLNLAALAILAYTHHRSGSGAVGNKLRQLAALALICIVVAFGALQWRLSTLAWEHTKYLSQYLEIAARSMGRVAAHPERVAQCPDIMTVCALPPEKRRELMDRLVRYRVNVFSPEFQSFHRLKPDTEAALIQDDPLTR
jgi:hypothetical protein